MNWQPIETAPKNETPILGYFKTIPRIRACWWSEFQAKKHGVGWAYDNNGLDQPTHWMLLPEPPEEDA